MLKKLNISLLFLLLLFAISTRTFAQENAT